MIQQLAGTLNRVWDWLLPPDKTIGEGARGKTEAQQILEAVEQARRDWQASHAYFNNVTSPDLIDHAIYQIQAAERKYVYLLRRAHELGLVAAHAGCGSDHAAGTGAGVRTVPREDAPTARGEGADTAPGEGTEIVPGEGDPAGTPVDAPAGTRPEARSAPPADAVAGPGAEAVAAARGEGPQDVGSTA